MRLRGLCYDVGVYMEFNWRQDFDRKAVYRIIYLYRPSP